MTRKLLTVAAVLALLPASYGVNAALTAAEAQADTPPTATMLVVKNIAGDRAHGYRCVIASTGGVDCDWDTPVRVPRG